MRHLVRGSKFGKKREFLQGLLGLYRRFEESDPTRFVTGKYITRDKEYTFYSKKELRDLIEKVISNG